MGIANVTWYIHILWSMYGCVQNIGAYEFEIVNEVRKFQNLNLVMWNYVMDVTILWTMYTLTLLKSFDFLWQAYGHTKIRIAIFTIFRQDLDIITIIIFQFCNLKLNCT
jgi:hypothetical protein